MNPFEIITKDPHTPARLGKLTTLHGEVETPVFMPVGTRAAVRGMDAWDLDEMQAGIMLANTYHLYLQPGSDLIRRRGGLHGFMGWNKPILTDSGGYQVFSLGRFREIDGDGVTFRSLINGALCRLEPESVVDIQNDFGSDIMMPLDVCAPHPASREVLLEAIERTVSWLRRTQAYRNRMIQRGDWREGTLLFGITQGGVDPSLRRLCWEQIAGIPVDGWAIGGLSVGEPAERMLEVTALHARDLDETKPRYLMGVGLPDQIVEAVGHGIDLFDTVVPTRYGRHGTAFTDGGRLNILNRRFRDDDRPLDESCRCRVCRRFSRAYIRHLLKAKELTGLRLVSYHNVWYYGDLMRRIRDAIKRGRYAAFRNEFLDRFRRCD